MTELINIVCIACLSVVIVTFQPILQSVRNWLIKIIENPVIIKWNVRVFHATVLAFSMGLTMLVNACVYFMYKLLTCAKCAGLWIGLALTFNLLSAALISILAEFIYRKVFNAS